MENSKINKNYFKYFIKINEILIVWGKHINFSNKQKFIEEDKNLC